VIVAFAGRRVDAAGAVPARFPPGNADPVAERVRRVLVDERATAVVSSGACGADLIAQQVAGALRLRRRIVLPFDRARFRKTSVIDRGGDWGAVYDRLLGELDVSGDVVELSAGEGDAAYAATNTAILDEATALGRASSSPVLAVIIWDGASRGSSDLTAAFADAARQRGLRVAEVRTL
jgi:hypothetical protein